MTPRLMILPATDKARIRLLRIPPDYEAQELYRHVTGLIAQVEEQEPGFSSDDVVTLLEEHGFESIDFQLGPSLD
ncbi:MAG: hypothetical protein H6959_08280 [Chromatiaceae bacterium]|nr:hypothetical protein [Gammaproteobacteria bacterium]MCP5422904.1 hypothetical protein [Chromatiaceae bacterium]